MNTVLVLVVVLVAILVIGMVMAAIARDEQEQRRIDDICDRLEREPAYIDRRLYRAPVGRAFGEVVDWKLPSVPTEPMESSDD